MTDRGNVEWLQKPSCQLLVLFLYSYQCELSIHKEENVTWTNLVDDLQIQDLLYYLFCFVPPFKEYHILI